MKLGFALFLLFCLLAYLNHKDVLGEQATWIIAVILFFSSVLFAFVFKRFLK